MLTSSGKALRQTFDQAASLYDAVRPDYPAPLFNDLVALSGIPADGRILEIGCGTGQATRPLAERGYRIVAIELGSHLAARARQNLASFPEVRVITGAFEDEPVEAATFDLVLAATSFHWLDPAVAFPKIAQALRPGGALALCWNVHVMTEGTAAFFDAIQPLYAQAMPSEARLPPWPDEVPDRSSEITQSGYFGPVAVCRYPWQTTYDTATYLQLLSTYSNHIALTPAARSRLYHGVAAIIDGQFGGHIRKDYLAELYVATKLRVES